MVNKMSNSQRTEAAKSSCPSGDRTTSSANKLLLQTNSKQCRYVNIRIRPCEYPHPSPERFLDCLVRIKNIHIHSVAATDNSNRGKGTPSPCEPPFAVFRVDEVLMFVVCLESRRDYVSSGTPEPEPALGDTIPGRPLRTYRR